MEKVNLKNHDEEREMKSMLLKLYLNVSLCAQELGQEAKTISYAKRVCPLLLSLKDSSCLWSLTGSKFGIFVVVVNHKHHNYPSSSALFINYYCPLLYSLKYSRCLLNLIVQVLNSGLCQCWSIIVTIINHNHSYPLFSVIY